MPTKIVCRATACKCGCGGRDPWHARFFHRTLREVQPTSRFEPVVNGFWTMSVPEQAVAQFPWGQETVYHFVTMRSEDGRIVAEGWFREGMIPNPIIEDEG